MALQMLVRRMQPQSGAAAWADADGRAIAVHGLRVSFRTWAGDRTSFAREVVEAALSHQVGGTEGAYMRGDQLERRRPLMKAWGDFVDGKSGAEVIDIDGRRSA